MGTSNPVFKNAEYFQEGQVATLAPPVGHQGTFAPPSYGQASQTSGQTQQAPQTQQSQQTQETQQGWDPWQGKQPQPGWEQQAQQTQPGWEQQGQQPGQPNAINYAQTGAAAGQAAYSQAAGGWVEAAPGYRMTIDDVITKSAIVMGALILVAAGTFWGLIRWANNLATVSTISIVTTIAVFVTVLLVSARRKIAPGLVLAYSVLEGVCLGSISLLFEYLYPGIVMPAVLGTFVAAAATLACYKFFRIRVTGKFKQMVAIGTISFAGVAFISLILSLFGVNLGIITVGGGVGWLAVLFSILGVGLAVFNLIIDFDYIEQGISHNAPASESWRAAFGLTVTMVWLYIELLRILSYFRN